ncbi:hypothetical protein K0M31_018676 [Melipona bicolor]|uniref:Uncharacterized protein n=1 Tax=Melipona bicolor TaxID=60889 RepID=A0AA40G426_9HYME|nr:hypothetical protein K0M31_018676 [Melipona bicolor]
MSPSPNPRELASRRSFTRPKHPAINSGPLQRGGGRRRRREKKEEEKRRNEEAERKRNKSMEGGVEKTLNRTRDDEWAAEEKGLVDERVAREKQWRHLGSKRQRSDGKACAKGPPRVGGARKKRREVSRGQGGWNAEEEKEEEVVVLVSTG